jgi:hypothetical protein
MQSSNESPAHIHTPPSTLTCSICGLAMYPTDRGNYEITYHCSSPEARFWDFDRGTSAQAIAKDHWDKSRLEIFLQPPASQKSA